VRFDDEGYAREQLVAELGAALLCTSLASTLELRVDYVVYIAALAKSVVQRHAANLLRRHQRPADCRLLHFCIAGNMAVGQNGSLS